MKIRSPRSSFHHESVIRSGRRRSSSRATATAAERTAKLSCHRLEAHVHVQAAVAGGLDVRADAELVEQRLHLGRRLLRHRERRCPGRGRGRCAARRSAAGRDARIGHEWKPRQPRLTAQTKWARSAMTSARDCVPFGVLTMVVCSQSGALSGIRFWKKFEPADPLGKRCSSTGRSAIAASPRRRCAGRSGRGRAWCRRGGKKTLSGLVISTVRPATSTVLGLAVSRSLTGCRVVARASFATVGLRWAISDDQRTRSTSVTAPMQGTIVTIDVEPGQIGARRPAGDADRVDEDAPLDRRARSRHGRRDPRRGRADGDGW